MTRNDALDFLRKYSSDVLNRVWKGSEEDRRDEVVRRITRYALKINRASCRCDSDSAYKYVALFAVYSYENGWTDVYDKMCECLFALEDEPKMRKPYRKRQSKTE